MSEVITKIGGRVVSRSGASRIETPATAAVDTQLPPAIAETPAAARTTAIAVAAH